MWFVFLGASTLMELSRPSHDTLVTNNRLD